MRPREEIIIFWDSLKVRQREFWSTRNFWDSFFSLWEFQSPKPANHQYEQVPLSEPWWNGASAPPLSDIGLHCWEKRLADPVQVVQTLYAQAGPHLYLKNLAPVPSGTYDPRALKELVVIWRLQKWRSIKSSHIFLSQGSVWCDGVSLQKCRKQSALRFSSILPSSTATSLSDITRATTSTTTQSCWGKIWGNSVWEAHGS